MKKRYASGHTHVICLKGIPDQFKCGNNYKAFSHSIGVSILNEFGVFIEFPYSKTPNYSLLFDDYFITLSEHRDNQIKTIENIKI